MATKICAKCSEEKNVLEFHFRKDTGSYRKICKGCHNNKARQYKEDNKEIKKEKDKIYYEEHKEERSAYRKKYHADNRERENVRDAEYAIAHKDRLAVYYQEYRNEHKKDASTYYSAYRIKNADKIRKRSAAYSTNRKKNDPLFKLRSRLSVSIFLSLKTNGRIKCEKSILQFLPYSMKDLKLHLESQFESWMNWDNHGKYNVKTWNDNDSKTWKWNIDHIIPHSTFNYVSMEDREFRDCWALSNLRPLSAKQNVIDGASKVRHDTSK